MNEVLMYKVLERIRDDLNILKDATDRVMNTAPHASPEMRQAQSRGNDLRKALSALEEF